MADDSSLVRQAVRLRAQRLAHAADLEPPSRGSRASAGLDLRAAIPGPLVLEPGERARVATGWRLEIPTGWEGQVRPRSGLALDSGVTVLNAPGTIDSDYRGEVSVLLVNLGDRPVTIERGERIAQLVVAPVAEVTWNEVSELEDTVRGEGGFGSTGR